MAATAFFVCAAAVGAYAANSGRMSELPALRTCNSLRSDDARGAVLAAQRHRARCVCDRDATPTPLSPTEWGTCRFAACRPVYVRSFCPSGPCRRGLARRAVRANAERLAGLKWGAWRVAACSCGGRWGRDAGSGGSEAVERTDAVPANRLMNRVGFFVWLVRRKCEFRLGNKRVATFSYDGSFMRVAHGDC